MGGRFLGRHRGTLPARGARHLRLLRHLLLAGAGSRPPQQLSELGREMRRRHQGLAQPGPGISITGDLMRKLIALLPFFAGAAHAGTLFLGAYPDAVIVFDEAKGKIVDRIHLETGLPTSLRLSHDKKKIFVTTNDHAGVEVIDVATHKVLSHFVLDNGAKRYRFNGGVPDPEGKVLYAMTTEITKQIDRYEIGKPKYTVIDLEQQKIARTADLAPEDERAAGGGGRGGGFQISPDGKYLYQFRDTVVILNTSDFKVVDRLPLSKPDLPGIESISFGGQLDSIAEPGMYVS